MQPTAAENESKKSFLEENSQFARKVTDRVARIKPRWGARDSDVDSAWRLIKAAARGAADAGWDAAIPPDDPRRPLIDLYLPDLATPQPPQPITVGHLGQSLDGFIATHEGESRWVTGPENMVHMHRMRALCDAVLVGPGTVAIDDPQLTTRLVDGPNPLRVVLDPTRGLEPRYKLFTDGAAETRAILQEIVRQRRGETHVGCAHIAGRRRHCRRRDRLARR